jgi:hypothetical protein
VQRNLAALAWPGLAWLVHSRTSGSDRWRAQRPGNRLEQLDREQRLVSCPPADGRPAPASQTSKRERRALTVHLLLCLGAATGHCLSQAETAATKRTVFLHLKPVTRSAAFAEIDFPVRPNV